MIMNPIEFAVILVMAGMLALVVAFGLGWLACDMRAGKQLALDPSAYGPYRQMAEMFEDPEPHLEADLFDKALEAFLEDEPADLERVATTGELAVLRDQTAWIKDRADEFIESLGGEAA